MRKYFIAMLQEIPSDTVVQRIMSRTDTAEQMICEIEANSDIGLEFVTNVLRISRDMLIRQAARNA